MNLERPKNTITTQISTKFKVLQLLCEKIMNLFDRYNTVNFV